MNDLFNTKEKVEQAIADFTNLLNQAGWITFVSIVDKNIDHIRDQLERGTTENETKADVDRLRDKLNILREMRDTPQSMIAKLTQEEVEELNPDPYATAEDIRNLRGGLNVDIVQ